MTRQARSSAAIMGSDTHMILETRACSLPLRQNVHQVINRRTRHYAGTLVIGVAGAVCLSAGLALALRLLNLSAVQQQCDTKAMILASICGHASVRRNVLSPELFGVSIGTIAEAEHRIQPLLAQRRHVIEPVGTVSDLTEPTTFAAAHDVPLTPGPKRARISAISYLDI
jgi:hypothetical protein